MKARFIHDGKAIDFTPEVDTPAGSVLILGSLTGITKIDLKAGELGALHLVGVYDIEKAAADVVTVGAKIYWKDDKATIVASTTVSQVTTDHPYVGVAIEAAAAGDTTVRVRIG
jgi:predicted RecA/RadA family phage recombinase